MRSAGLRIALPEKAEIKKALLISLWAAALFLPFRDAWSALALFILLFLGMIITLSASGLRGGAAGLFKALSDFIRAAFVNKFVASVLGLILLVLPFVLKDYYLDVLIISGIYILLALGLNVIVGFAGLLNLGFAAFYAIGAYTYALLSVKIGLGFWAALPFSAGLAALAGVLLSVPALRLRGDYLALVTLGFGEILRLVLNNWDSFTNGPNGISGIAPPEFIGIPLDTLNYFYYLVLSFVVTGVIVISRVERSRIGRAWIALRENEIAASSIGINPIRYKLFAFAFGTFWAGIAGALYAAKMRFVSPESFTFMESILILSMVILGGIGNVYGAVTGALLLVLLPELLRDVQMYRMLILGIGLVAMMIYRPKGMLGFGR